MAKKSDNFFETPPSLEVFERYLQESAELKLALKKETRSGLVRYMETIRMCTNVGMPLRAISVALNDLHSVHFDHTAIHRFLKEFPALRLRAEVSDD